MYHASLPNLLEKQKTYLRLTSSRIVAISRPESMRVSKSCCCSTKPHRSAPRNHHGKRKLSRQPEVPQQPHSSFGGQPIQRATSGVHISNSRLSHGVSPLACRIRYSLYELMFAAAEKHTKRPNGERDACRCQTKTKASSARIRVKAGDIEPFMLPLFTFTTMRTWYQNRFYERQTGSHPRIEFSGTSFGAKLTGAFNVAAFLEQTKNDAAITDTIRTALFTDMNPYQVCFFEKDERDPVPDICIVNALASPRPCVKVQTRGARRTTLDNTSWNIWMAGISHETSRPIEPHQVGIYQELLKHTMDNALRYGRRHPPKIRRRARRCGEWQPAGMGDHPDHWRQFMTFSDDMSVVLEDEQETKDVVVEDL
ncbi:hypothetical protein FA95DRAFT_1600056 [Auriscalpium vulgare]|uniref:Uncharacterized protein n=1 Tax=Auriscalpium vulgare TaxID=40419 RepID=A0ACB8R3G9_9AGAM|nr:hypothetical protein FA95DRAFT_1600056 [Auriscalpium vulgare]